MAAQFLAAFEDPAVVVDGTGHLLAWNPAAECSFELQGATGRPLADLGIPTPADPASLVSLPLALDEGGGTLHVWQPARTILPPEAIALQKAQAVAWMAGRASHNVANHLGSLLPITDMVSSDPRLPADLRDLASRLHESADTSLQVMRNILEIVRVREAQPRVLGLGEIVATVLDLEAGVLMNVEGRRALPTDLPEVYGDPARLRQVVLGITASAIAAMGGSEARGQLRISATLATAGTSTVRLVVEDSAPVIPPGERDTLFDAYPPDAAGSARPGSDLAVAAGLAALDGGRLSYEPLPDGNRFILELPAAADVMDGAARARRPEASSVPPSLPSADRPTPVILLCDDEPSILQLLARFIEKAGYRTIQTASADIALDHIAHGDVDAVIADQRLVDMTGSEMYVRACAVRPSLARRFLIMSGDPGASDLLAFSARTHVQVLAKPFDFHQVPALVKALCEA